MVSDGVFCGIASIGHTEKNWIDELETDYSALIPLRRRRSLNVVKPRPGSGRRTYKRPARFGVAAQRAEYQSE